MRMYAPHQAVPLAAAERPAAKEKPSNPPASARPPHRLADFVDANPIQAMSFARFAGLSRLWNWSYNASEDKLLARERQTEDFLKDMQPLSAGPYDTELKVLRTEFSVIKKATYAADQYQTVQTSLDALFANLDKLSSRAAAASIRFDAIVKDTCDRIPQIFLADQTVGRKNRENVRNALNPNVEAFAEHAFETGWVTAYNVDFAAARAPQVLEALERTEGRVTRDWQGVAQQLNLHGAPLTIELTGSDFHAGGEQVCIIITNAGEKAVYKPRSVAPDQALMGHAGSAFAKLNTLSGGGVSLPTMKFVAKNDEHSAYGYAEFKQHTPQLSADQIRQYYRHFGQLAVAAKLFGVNDLHHENIMTVGAEPVVIDAETAFIPYVMRGGAPADKTGISASLTAFSLNMKLGNNYFLDPADTNEFGQLAHGKAWSAEERESELADFVRTKRANDLRGQKKYFNDFRAGIVDVLETVGAHRAEIAEDLEQRVAGTASIRIVPLATAIFKSLMSQYHGSLTEKSQDFAAQILDNAEKQIVASLADKGFELVNGGEAVIARIVKQNFARGDVPLLRFQNNLLTFDGTAIARSRDLLHVTAFIRDVVDQVAATHPDKIIESVLP